LTGQVRTFCCQADGKSIQPQRLKPFKFSKKTGAAPEPPVRQGITGGCGLGVFGQFRVIEQMTNRLFAAKTLAAAVDRIMTDVIALHGAEFGDIQLVTPRGLALVGQHGFDTGFVSTFLLVDLGAGTVCARAYRERHPVVVPDVETDAAFEPFRDAARRSGFRAVQSTPMITDHGTVVGVVSTHFAHVYEPTPIEMMILADYSRLAGDYCQQFLEKSGAAQIQDLCDALAHQVNLTPPAPPPDAGAAQTPRTRTAAQLSADIILPPT